nr:NADH dehydrogenase subunit 2 [Lepidophthirus macrorhini]
MPPSMKKKKHQLPMKSAFSVMILFSLMLILSSSTWWMSWVGLELSTLFFITFVSYTKGKTSNVFLWRYLIVQIVCSTAFLCSVLQSNQIQVMNSHFSYETEILSIVAMLSMLVKMGMPPFHGWFITLSQSMSWTNFLMLSTLMKVGPILILINLDSSQCQTFLILVTSLSMVIGCIGVLDTSVRRILVCSSIVNTGWMVIGLHAFQYQSMLYMLVYFILLSGLILILKLENVSTTSELYGMAYCLPSNLSSIVLFLMISLSGLPPLVMFMVKLEILSSVMNTNFMIIIIGLQAIIPAIFMIVAYINFILWSAQKGKTFVVKKPISALTVFSIAVQLWLACMLFCLLLK